MQAQRVEPSAVSPPADLDLLDAPVRDQYARIRGRLDGLLATAGSPHASRAQAFGELGQWFHVYRYFERARQSFEIARDLAPTDYRWPYYLGHSLRELGRVEHSATSFRRALELRPLDVASMVWLGILEFESGRSAAARQWLVRSVELEPTAVRAWTELGRLALSDGDDRRAVEYLETAVELQPDAVGVHYSLGIAYRGLGDLERAREHLRLARVEKSIRSPARLSDPLLGALDELREGSRPLAGRAQLLFEEGRFLAAAEEFARAAEANPQNPSLGANRGLALLNAGRVEEAVATMSELTSRFPDYAAGQYNLGVALIQSGDYEAAVERIRQAIALDPGLVEARDALASGLILQNRPDEALAQYRRIHLLDPASEQARYRYSALLTYLGRHQEARLAVEEARQVLPQSRRLALLYGRLLAASPDAAVRNGSEALSLAQAAVSQSPTVFAAQTVAMAYAEIGNFEEAVSWQRSALEKWIETRPGAPTGPLEERLEEYRAGRPCRLPLHPGEDEG